MDRMVKIMKVILRGEDIEFIWNDKDGEEKIEISQGDSKKDDKILFESFYIKKDELKRFIKKFTDPYIDIEIQEMEKERKKEESARSGEAEEGRRREKM